MNLQINRIVLVIGLFAFPVLGIAQVQDNIRYADTLKNNIEQVSIAFGRQNKDQVTSAVSSVRGFELHKTHTASTTNALIGKLTGVSILNNGGAPGFDDPVIYIRGLHTSLNNGYLILVDGIQINSLSYITPDEIESITVLKDAAALAIYGVRGGNGALLVTTKRGKASDKINISFNVRYGLQSPVMLPEVANSYEYARLHNSARINDGFLPLYSEKQLNGYRDGTDPYLYPNVNWYDEILRKNAPLQDYALTFNGGNDKVKYFLMVGYMANEGLYANTNQETNSNLNFNRINFRGNIDLNITKNLSAEVSLGGNIQDRMFPTISTEDLWRSMASYAPNLYSVRSPDGQITGSANYPINPVGSLLEKGYFSRHDRNIQSSLRVSQKLDVITTGLSVFGSLLFDNEFNNRYDKTRNYAYAEPIVGTNTEGEPYVYYLERGLNTDLTVRTDPNYENNRIILRAGFDYSRKFNNTDLTGMLMFQQDKYTVFGNQSPFAMQNLAGRFNYGFKDKYFAEFSFSYSGIENYAPGKRFGFFPAISGGWLLHKEAFWKQNSAINYLKLRASAGLVGNDRGAPRFNYNQYWGTQSSQGYYFGTGITYYGALVQLGTANPNITWEKGMIYNLGIEAKAFNSKLSFGADIFREMRSDILVNMGNATPSFSGIADEARQNRGKVLSYGTELFTRFNDQLGKLDYHVGAEFSFARNRIKANYDIPRKEAYSSRLNRPVGQYFGLEAIGFFKNESDIINSPQQTFSAVKPGDLKYRDQNNDGIIDVNDEVAIGRQIYPEINYSFNTGLAYKGLNLDFFFQGIAHRSVMMNGTLFQPFVNNNNIIDWAAKGHWTPETANAATFPRLGTEVSANNYATSDFWVRKANFLRLRNVELGYTLSKNISSKLRLQSIKVFVSGLNLLTWDDLDVDVDPETLSAGYPNIKTYTAGLSVKF